MKNLQKLIGIIALITVIGFSMIACGNGNGGRGPGIPVPQTVTYNGVSADGSTYTLKITEPAARYTAQDGDTYELTVTSPNGTTKTSKGTVTKAGNEMELTPNGTTEPFTVKVSAEGLIGISGNLKWDGDKETTTLPGELTPVTAEVAQLAAELNAINNGSARADGNTVTLTDNVTLNKNLTMEGGAIFGNAAPEGNGGGVNLDEANFIMNGGRIQGGTDSDGFAKNTALRSRASLDAGGRYTAKWGTGGTYTIGGVAQTGGSDIGPTGDTLIAIPAR